MHGRLDVIINNAGVGAQHGKIGDISIENFQKIMDVNTNGAWYTLKYAVTLIVIH